jgi:hypothetical protein
MNSQLPTKAESDVVRRRIWLIVQREIEAS